jgi:hypothetical protein
MPNVLKVKNKVIESVVILTIIFGIISLILWKPSEIDWVIGETFPIYLIPTIPLLVGICGIIVSAIGLLLAKRSKCSLVVYLVGLLLNMVVVFIALFGLGRWVYLE